jgi:hypothetical protein
VWCPLAPPLRPCRTFLFVASQRWFRLPPHGRSPARSCLHLVLCQSERSLGILTSLRLPVSHTGLAPVKITPMPGVHQPMQPSGGLGRRQWWAYSSPWADRCRSCRRSGRSRGHHGACHRGAVFKTRPGGSHQQSASPPRLVRVGRCSRSTQVVGDVRHRSWITAPEREHRSTLASSVVAEDRLPGVSLLVVNTAPRWRAAWWRQGREGRVSGGAHRPTEASSAVAWSSRPVGVHADCPPLVRAVRLPPRGRTLCSATGMLPTRIG